MKINKLLNGIKELIKKISPNEEVEYFYLPNKTYRGYVLVINIIEERKVDQLYVKGSILKHLKMEGTVENRFTLAGKSTELKGEKYINSIYCEKIVNFSSNLSETREIVADVKFTVLIENLNEENNKGIIKELEIKEEEIISKSNK